MRPIGIIGLRATFKCLIAGSITLLVASPHVRAGQPVELSQRDSLRGLIGVEVHVDPLPIEIEELGLPSGKLQHQIREHLQESGITVLTERERFAGHLGGLLDVRVEATHDRISRFFYTIHVSLKRRVQLEGPPQPGITAVTWMKLGAVGSIADDNVTYLRDQTLRKVDQFIKDYLAVNPNQKGATIRGSSN